MSLKTCFQDLFSKPVSTPPSPQVRAVSRDLASRAGLPPHVVQLVNSFPSKLHPMAQFSAAITAMQSESKFAKGYADGMPKSQYWEVSLVLDTRERGEVLFPCSTRTRMLWT